VLEAVARALQLDEDERSYLFDLAGTARPARHDLAAARMLR
jgi:hypothetical protein